ncbi:MAG: DUF2147 domain-containing protein [Cohaesibacter sp.]|nr:DUF2147 domain-containing protein [Cohaesibacter sp.]
MKIATLLCASPKLLCASLCLFASPALADPVFGNWKTQPGDTGAYAHVKIGPCGSNICGTITKVVGKKTGKASPVGKLIIKNMKAKGSGSYGGGTIWAPDKDKTYSSKMSLKGKTLSVSGCVAGGLLCRSQKWTRL